MKHKVFQKLKIVLIPVICLALIGALAYAMGMFSPKPDYLASHYDPAITDLYPVESFIIEKNPGLTKYAENDQLILWISEETATFAVEKKANGTIWYSSPLDDPELEEINKAADPADKIYMNSIVSLTYYHPSGTKQSLYSSKDSVSRGQYKISKTSDGANIIFVFGNLESELMIVPSVISATDFEEKVLANESITSEDSFNIKRYYFKDAGGDYVFGETLGKVAQQNAYDIFIRLGLDPEKDFSAQDPGSGEGAKNPLFAVTLDIRLNGDAAEITLPVSEIKFTSTYPIAEIRMNEYFGSGDNDDEGYLLVPDGSGSLIYFNSPGSTEGRISLPVYGTDETKGLRFQEKITQKASLPVFGINKNGQGILAVIEGGASIASVNGFKSGSVKRPYSGVYPSYTLIDQSSVVLGEGEYDAKAYTYQRAMYEGELSVSYFFMEEETTGYAAMANRYRDHLISLAPSSGTAFQEEATQTDIPFTVEFIGAVRGTQTFLGVSYRGEEVLTTFDQVSEIVGSLRSDGINRINARLTGFFNGGYDQSLPVRFKPLSKLGGWSGFRELQDKTDDGSMIFADVILQTAYAGDGFNINRQASKTMDGRNARVYSYYNKITQKGERPKYILSPSHLNKVINSFLDVTSKYKIGSVSLNDLGSKLYQDYSSKEPVTREDSLEIILAQIGNVREKTEGLMIDSANVYAVPYADIIVNVPLSDSRYFIEDRAVPFYQIAVRGIADHAGTPWNISADPVTEFLKSVEYGAGVHFRWIYAPSQSTKNTEHSKLFSLNYLSSYDQAVEFYRRANEALKNLQNQSIVHHDAVTEVPGVTLTEYGDGTKIYVNYNSSAAKIDGITVEALSFARKDGDN